MEPTTDLASAEPPRDCPRCPRLVALREELRAEYPDWWNAPVPALGDSRAWLAIVGLAPGKHGANRTGRPFTGDYAGELLFATLLKFGLAEGVYEARPDDSLRLKGAAIINSVKCLPPENKPLPQEIGNCRTFLEAQAQLLPARVFVPLGRIAHDSLLRVLGVKASAAKFGHCAEHRLPGGQVVIDSYHCSRYNQNTGRLTAAMFEAVFERAIAVRAELEGVG
jgi:uracil-DNA glycosylase family 4